MKKFFNLLFVFSLLSIVYSCSNNDNSEDSTTIYQFVQKNINANTNSIIDSTTYQLYNDKIISSERINIATNQSSNADYTYTNGKISSIFGYVNSVLLSKQFYFYENNKLSEFRMESYNTTNVLTQISKQTFTYTLDTIFSEWKRSTDGINYNLILKSKMKIENNNRVFYESYSPINNENKRIIMDYDSNGNPLNQEYYIKQQDVYVSTQTNTMSYDNGINSFGKIMDETYGRETLMLLYHLQSNAINDINVKSLCKNTINTFVSTFDSTITFSVNSIVNTQNYAKKIEYISLVNGAIFSRFQQDFYFN